MSRNKQIYLPAPLSDYFAPVFCSRPYETQMSSEARASYRALSITSLRAPEALTPDYWLQHKGCFLPPAAPPQMIQQTSRLFFFALLKRNFIWQLMRPEIVVERIVRKDGAVGWMCLCACVRVRVHTGRPYTGRGIKGGGVTQVDVCGKWPESPALRPGSVQ